VKKAIGVGSVVLLGLIAAVGARQAPFKRTVLQEAELSVPNRDLVTAIAELAPGVAPGPHTHPGEEIGYILDGSVLLEQDGKPPVTLKAGQTFLIPPEKVHNATNNGTGPARILANYIVERGKALATPVPPK
jgi:quercetin dioxygenase-like cupin family protein